MMWPTCALVAQLDRVQVSEAWGRGFDPAGRTNLFYKINNLYIFWRIFGVMRYLSTGLEVILLLIKGPSFTVVSHSAIQINRQLF